MGPLVNQQLLIEQARKLIYQGADHLEVLKFLNEMQASDDDMKKTLIILENDFVKYQLADQERAKILNHIFIGVFLAILGGAWLIYQILTDGYRHYQIYAIIFAGVWWSYRNFIRYHKPLEDFLPPEQSVSWRRFKKRF